MTFYSIASMVTGILAVLFILVRIYDIKAGQVKITADADKIHLQLSRTYPSDKSIRGYFSDYDNTFPKDSFVYFIVEGDSFYFVADENMELKLQIPIKNVISIDQISSKQFYRLEMDNIPDAEIIYGINKVVYNDNDVTKELYFIQGYDDFSKKFNRPKTAGDWIKPTFDFYIRDLIEK